MMGTEASASSVEKLSYGLSMWLKGSEAVISLKYWGIDADPQPCWDNWGNMLNCFPQFLTYVVAGILLNSQHTGSVKMYYNWIFHVSLMLFFLTYI